MATLILPIDVKNPRLVNEQQLANVVNNLATTQSAVDDALWRAASARVGVDGIYFDGATTSRALTMSAPAALASLPTWGAASFVLPAAAYSTAPTICAQSSTGAATVAYGQDITIAATAAGDLVFATYGSSTSNFRKATLANFRATFSGLRVSLIWSFVAGSAAPSVWVNGVAQTLTVTTGGTPPDFCASTLVTSVHKFLANWNASTATLIGYGLGTLTQSDVDMHVVSGMLPFWARAAASTAATYTSTFDAGVDGFYAQAGAVVGNVDGVSDGVTSYDNCLRFTGSGAGTYPAFVRGFTYPGALGGRYMLTFKYLVPAASTVLSALYLTDLVAPTTTFSTKGVWTSVSIAYTPGSSSIVLGLKDSAGSINFTTTETAYIRDVVVTPLGALAIPLYQKSIYTSDETGNGNYGTIVGGTAKVRFDIRTANIRDWTPYAAADTVLGVTDTAYTMLQKLDARIDEAAYQLQAGAAELAIPLSYTGTGAGVLTMRLFSDIAQTATIDGSGKFYTDAAGTLNEATNYAMAANAWTTFYIRVPSSTCTMRVPYGRAIRQLGNASNSFLGETANGPKVNNLATTKIRQSVGSIYVYAAQNLCNVSGQTYPWLNATQLYFNGTSLTVSGQTYPWVNVTQVIFSGVSLNVSGQTYPWLNATQVIFSGASLTITANLSTSVLYSGASNFELYINGTGISASYPTTRAWPRNISRVYVRPATGSMVSADVDRILIDIASTANLAAVGSKVIDLGGNCGAPTAASSSAITTLTNLGFAVTVNT